MMNLRRWLRDEKGSILLFTTALVVPLMIIFGGLALDLAHVGTVDRRWIIPRDEPWKDPYYCSGPFSRRRRGGL